MLTNDEIRNEIAAIGKSAASLRQIVQVVAVSIIGHAYTHGDVTQGDNLLHALGKGTDRQALVAYFEDHGPFRWVKDEAKFKLDKKRRDNGSFDEEKLLTGVQWFEYGRSTKNLNSTFDLAKRTLSLIEGMGKAKEKAGTIVENAELAPYLTAAVKQYNADKAEALRTAFEQGDVTAGVERFEDQLTELKVVNG